MKKRPPGHKKTDDEIDQEHATIARAAGPRRTYFEQGERVRIKRWYTEKFIGLEGTFRPDGNLWRTSRE